MASANDVSPSCASLACLGADPRRPECWAATAGARQGRAVRTATPVVGLEGAHHASARRDGAASVRLRARKVRSTGATAAVRGEGECVGEGRRDRPNRRKAHAALEIKPTPCGAIYLQHVRFWSASAATIANSPKKLAGNRPSTRLLSTRHADSRFARPGTEAARRCCRT